MLALLVSKGRGDGRQADNPHNKALNPEAPIVRGDLPPLGLIWHHVAVPKCSWLSPKGVRTQERTHGDLRRREVGVTQAPHSSFSLQAPLEMPSEFSESG